ncbi:unnamed protein product [Larinioides sclopetarius]|uniref:CCHC-type domain-containing protein n=1 Tax=Larinioides sclopetarius TaxID=280406 RepID=A0AAV1ZX15_9ARAC
MAEGSRLQVRARDRKEDSRIIEAHSASSSRKEVCEKPGVCYHCHCSGHFWNRCPELSKHFSTVSSRPSRSSTSESVPVSQMFLNPEFQRMLMYTSITVV